LRGTTSHPTTVREGVRADKAAFKRMTPGQRVLHLATHGYYLATACADRRDCPQDGLEHLLPSGRALACSR